MTYKLWQTGSKEDGWERQLNDEKISVIVPIYRVEPYLCKCLNSIIDQTYQNLEIILIDDGSPDRCGIICDEYLKKDGRIKVIHKENGGVSSARNAGLEIATGDWIAWIDPDDWIEKDMFQYLYEGVQKYQADVAICGMRKVGMDTPLTFQYRKEKILDREQALQELLKNRSMTLSCCDKLTKRTLWDKLRFSDLKIGEDLLIMGRLLDRADVVVCLPEIKYNYLTRPQSALTDSSLDSRMDCWRAAIQQYHELAPKWPQLKPVLAGRSAASAIGIWAAYLGAAKNKQKEILPEIERIAAFCSSHIQDALTHVELGLAGRIVLKVTPFPKWWAFFIAAVAGWFYRQRYKRAL